MNVIKFAGKIALYLTVAWWTVYANSWAISAFEKHVLPLLK
jgi:uncharacterized membrane protein